MDRTQPCGGCNVGSIPTGSTILSVVKNDAPGARARGACVLGIERFCGDPFSRMGSKTRAEKFLTAAAVGNVLGRSYREHSFERSENEYVKSAPPK
jgi:hypothetical protein